MNKAILIGRLTRDPELKTTQTAGAALCNFTIAVDRRFQKQGEEKQADFINCVAWRTTAEFITKYFRKGSKIVVVGSIQTRKYEDKDGRMVYVTEVVVDEVEFAESKRQDDDRGYDAPPAPAPDDDTSLPFDL
jgi:single-strand DNA-binding protein